MKKHSIDSFKRTIPSPERGLTTEEAALRHKAGLHNKVTNQLSKTGFQIIRDNLFTFFNFLFFGLAFCLFLVGAYADMLFIVIVFANILIGIVQAFKVKATLNKIRLLSDKPAQVLRDGRLVPLGVDELVLDDIVRFGPGSQICADAVICIGCVEVNEALLTGEADVVAKAPEDLLLSGSFVVSGTCTARLSRVGADAYASGITAAKSQKATRSKMMRDLDRMLKFIGVGIIPLGLIMFIKQVLLPHTELPFAVSSTVAAMVGMIPEGLYLLVNVALAVSVINLARRRTLVHELSCIENLARVDTLCLDKTGTLTEGTMALTTLIPAEGFPKETLAAKLSAYAVASGDTNATAAALKKAFPKSLQKMSFIREVPFCSERKWSALVSSEEGCFYLGAPEMLLDPDVKDLEASYKKHLTAGRRVLLLAKGPSPEADNTLPAGLKPLGFAVFTDKIRLEARDTLDYFKKQGVTVKVISGDNALTVSEIARLSSVSGAQASLDASSLDALQDIGRYAESHTVFGRVSPEQKQVLIKSLKKSGHTVAMIGDGVNDVLALKEADCSIAMAAGSDAAQHAAQMVLLDSDFSVMPQIVKEGRRVINNIERSAVLFLVKNIFSFVLSFILLCTAAPYPFLPIQITLISTLMIGCPSFILTLEPSYNQVKGGFLKNVFLGALPGGLTDALGLLGILLTGHILGLSAEQTSTVCTLFAGSIGLMVLFIICRPLNPLRLTLLLTMLAAFIISIFCLGSWFHLVPLPPQGWMLFSAFTAAAPLILALCRIGIKHLYPKAKTLSVFLERSEQA